MDFVFRSRNTHEQLHVLDRDPTGKHLHRILKVRLEDDFSHAVNQGGRGGM